MLSRYHHSWNSAKLVLGDEQQAVILRFVHSSNRAMDDVCAFAERQFSLRAATFVMLLRWQASLACIPWHVPGIALHLGNTLLTNVQLALLFWRSSDTRVWRLLVCQAHLVQQVPDVAWDYRRCCSILLWRVCVFASSSGLQ
jgi:hypothetical protein